MKVGTFATIAPFINLGSCRLIGFAVGMLEPCALFSALCAYHGEGIVGYSKAAVVSVADNESSSHGFEGNKGTIERNGPFPALCNNASHNRLAAKFALDHGPKLFLASIFPAKSIFCFDERHCFSAHDIKLNSCMANFQSILDSPIRKASEIAPARAIGGIEGAGHGSEDGGPLGPLKEQ